MSSLFQWREPRSALDADWAISCKLFNNISASLFKALLSITLIGLISLHFAGTKISPVPGLIILGLIFSFWCNYLIRRNFPIILTDKGIRHHLFRLIPWSEIQLYFIENEGEEHSSMRRIEIKANGKWCRFYFDAQKTNEANLRAILNRFLPREREMTQL
jgi:hypothetical protein